MGRDLEAVSLPNDNSSEASRVQERPLVQYPTTEKDKDEWQSKFASMRDSESTSTSQILPGLELTGDLSPFSNKSAVRSTDEAKPGATAGEGASIGPEQSFNGKSLNQQVEKIVNNAVEFQIVSNDTTLSVPVQEQLRSLQQQESEFLGQDQNKGDDDPGSPDTSVEVNGVDASAPIHSYGYQASIDKIGQERKEKFQEDFGTADSAMQRDLENLQTLAASALAGDVASLLSLYNTGLAPQGLEQVSIYDLKMRKETDGQVVLLAPRGDGAYSDEVTLVRNDGRPLSAMELGQYLRSDGTLLIGDRGQAYRPGQISLMAPPEMPDNLQKAPDSLQDVPENAQKVPDRLQHVPDPQKVLDKTGGITTEFSEKLLVSEQSELMSATSTLKSGMTEAREKFATWRDSKLQAQSLELASPDSTDLEQQKTDLVYQPREAAQEQRSIRTRLGETLRSIALRDLNDVKAWQLLAEKNNLSTDTDARGNPVAMLQRGMTLTLPSASEIEDFQTRACLAAASLS